MASETRIESIAMPDGGEMSAFVALPESGAGPGMLVLMEIFGVGDYIRDAARRLAAQGYVALAPDLYRRTRPGAVFGRDEAAMQEGMAAAAEMDDAGAVADAVAALGHLRRVPQATGEAGVLGFCLGGTLAFGVAVDGNPSTAVAYYGSGIADMLHRAGEIACPMLFHFGGQDPFIGIEDAERVARVAQDTAGWECHIHPDGGHAFDNWDNPMFSRPEPAARAWAQTTAFLGRTLPTGSVTP